ncbi:hypothetical protein [Novosphingobium aquae]|uniref:Uncharacterized protein n=1 Tax=Novosphingobium aquae TaxID=3133435 RepID=A0ABU8SC06_9SPHN
MIGSALLADAEEALAFQQSAKADRDAKDKIEVLNGSGIYGIRRLCDFAVRRDGSLRLGGMLAAYVVAFVILLAAGLSGDRK